MTLFSLIENRDSFVTRIETFPEYLLTGSLQSLTSSGKFLFCGTSQINHSLYHRDRFNQETTQHYYYYESPDGIQVSQNLSASLEFYDAMSTNEPRARVCKMLDDFYFTSQSDGSGSGFYGSQVEILSIPRAYYGSSFKNFVCVEKHLTNGTRVTWDDGKGNVFACDDRCEDTHLVGKAFYSEGIIYVRSDPAHFPNAVSSPWIDDSALCVEISFTGSHNIYTQNIFCHIPQYEANFSNNESAFTTTSNGEKVKILSGSDDRTFFTGVALYDEEYKLVGTAKFASPIRKKLNDKLLAKIRIDLSL